MRIRNMQLMPARISSHGILLGKPVDHRHRLLLIGNGNTFYFFFHIIPAANPGPKKTADPSPLKRAA